MTKKLLTFSVLVLAAGSFTKIAYLKDAFYIPMQEFMNLTHTQIGLALSVYGIVQAVGGSLSIYLSDRFSKKKIVPFGLIGGGLAGFYLATFPSFAGILLCWGLFSLFTEIICWPVILKSIRLLGEDREQGRMFSFLELGRGIVDVIVAFLGLQVFIYLGSNATALKGAIIFFAAVVIIVGVLSYLLLEDDVINLQDKDGKAISKNKAVLNGILVVLKTKEVWLASFVLFCVYSVYCGITYFLPFLKDVYAMPVAFLGFYGILNQYALKIIGSPLGGYGADKLTKSPTKFLRILFVVSAVIMAIIIFLPHENMSSYVYLGMFLTLSYGTIIFAMRSIYFAPISETKIPVEFTGSAMSIACMIGYLPRSFMYVIYGSILDNNPGINGYTMIFSIMLGFSILGIFVSSILIKSLKSMGGELQKK